VGKLGHSVLTFPPAIYCECPTLQPTLDTANIEKDKYAAKAKWTGYALNAAVRLQVLFGSLTTGLSALSVSGGISVNSFLMAYLTKATTAIGTSSFQQKFYSMMYFVLHRCFICLGSFISCSCVSCSCEGFKRTRTIYRLSPIPKTSISSFENVECFRWTMNI
jgi:uncharacterized membrane protein (Fun14 family)